MFTFRLNSYQLLQYLLIFYVSSELIAGQKSKKCAEVNEYCLNHWDCCSNSCMSYLYRCTRSYNVYPYPFLGVSYKPTVTLDQILEQNFGNSHNSIAANPSKPFLASRFGGADEAAASEVKIVQQKPQENTSESITSENPVVMQETSTVLETHLGQEGSEAQETDQRSTIKPACSEIGEKCYTREDCCSKLCHGYLHKCVT